MSKELQALNQQNKMAVWAERISACRNSGQGVKVWCQEHGICEGTFYKWQKKLFEIAKSQQQAAFVEVTPPVLPPSGLPEWRPTSTAEQILKSFRQCFRP